MALGDCACQRKEILRQPDNQTDKFWQIAVTAAGLSAIGV
jgi:hypothetical protein